MASRRLRSLRDRGGSFYVGSGGIAALNPRLQAGIPWGLRWMGWGGFSGGGGGGCARGLSNHGLSSRSDDAPVGVSREPVTGRGRRIGGSLGRRRPGRFSFRLKGPQDFFGQWCVEVRRNRELPARQTNGTEAQAGGWGRLQNSQQGGGLVGQVVGGFGHDVAVIQLDFEGPVTHVVKICDCPDGRKAIPGIPVCGSGQSP